MEGVLIVPTKVVIIHRPDAIAKNLAERAERALGGLGVQTLLVDVSRTTLSVESGERAAAAWLKISSVFRPDAVVLCGTESVSDETWGLPWIVVSDDPGDGGVQLSQGGIDDENTEQLERALARAIGRPVSPSSLHEIRTILVSGYFGAGNRGDDVIVTTLLEAIEQVSNTRTVLASPLPHQAITDYGRPAFDRLDAHECERWASVASAVVLGPGGLWDDYSIDSVGGFSGTINGATRSPAHLVQLPILVKGYGGQFLGVGLGAGPLRDGASRAAVRLSIELADHVSVRDEQSRQLLTDIAPGLTDRMELSPDLAWAATVPAAIDHGQLPWLPSGSWVVLNVRPWMDDTVQRAVWDETCAVARSRGLAVVCVPMQEQDAVLMQRLEPHKGVSVTHMPSSATHAEFMTTLTGADAIVAMRLHTSMLGHSVGVPGVGISYHPKVASHYRDIGRDAFVVDIKFHPGAVANLLRRALDEGIGEQHAALIQDRRRATERSLEALCAHLHELPARHPDEPWHAMPPAKAPRQPSLELSGTLVPLDAAVVTGRNLLRGERDVLVESRGTGIHGLEIAMTDRAPQRADVVQAVIRLSVTVAEGYRLALHLQPRCQESAELTGRMVHEILVEDTPVLSFDPAQWRQRTSVWITGTARSERLSIVVRTRATRDCENWGWGASAALTIEAVTTLPWKGQDQLVASSNPFAIVNPPPA